MKEISTAELIHSDEIIRDMKKVVGDDLVLKIFISPGNEPSLPGMTERKKMSKPRQDPLPAGNTMLSGVHFQE